MKTKTYERMNEQAYENHNNKKNTDSNNKNDNTTFHFDYNNSAAASPIYMYSSMYA